jgi:hypothetical protein
MCDCCDYIAARGGDPKDGRLIAEYERRWMRQTRAAVRENGWAAVTVDEWPPFSYTIGLWHVGHPELVIYGLEPEQAVGLLGTVADGICRAGVALDDGDGLTVGDWEFKAVPIPGPGEVVIKANDYFRRRPRESVPALQLVYPDVHGVWPWDPLCHLFPGQQPVPGREVA